MADPILWCLVERDYKAFSVICPLTTPIGVLKKLIREERKNGLLRNVDAADLIIWKVDLALPSRDEWKGLTAKNVPDSVKLANNLNTISDYWPATALLNPKHLHIIVEPPLVLDDDDQPSSKRPRLGDNRWPHGWTQLPDDDPWKLFGDYWRKKNVTTMSDVPSITLAYDEKGEEDPKYRLPFVAATENKIIVRDCYKPLYDYICFLRGEKFRGFILNGQPGTGKTLWLSYALVRLLMANETVVYYSHMGTYLFSGNSVYLRTSGEIPPADSATFCLIDLDHRTDSTEISFMTAEVLNTFPVLASSPYPLRYKSWQKQRDNVFTEYMPLWERDELKKGLEIQWFYNDLRKDVETVLCSPSVDHSSTISLIREEWRNHIVFALETIKDSRVDVTEDDATENDATEGDATEDDATEDDATESNAMNDVTGDDGTDNITVTVDEVLDELLDDVMEAYGPSARDVYRAIRGPGVARECIDEALRGLTFDSLREAGTKVGATEPNDTVSHTIFSMYPTRTIGNAHKPKPGSRFAVKFKSLWIRKLVLEELDDLQHLDTAFIIKELKVATHYARLQALCMEDLPLES